MIQKNSPVLQTMKLMNWYIMTSKDELPTSDNPLVIARQDINGYFALKDFIDGDDTVLFFPVSPHKLVIADRRGIYVDDLSANEQFLKNVKELIVSNAVLNVYSMKENTEIPTMRERIVDEKMYREIKNGFSMWQDRYRYEYIC